jgi:hypothetical protein
MEFCSMYCDVACLAVLGVKIMLFRSPYNYPVSFHILSTFSTIQITKLRAKDSNPPTTTDY